MANDKRLQHADSQDILAKEAYGDSILFREMRRKEYAGKILAEGAITAEKLDSARYTIDVTNSKIQARLGELGVDPITHTYDYDTEGIEQELDIVRENAHGRRLT